MGRDLPIGGAGALVGKSVWMTMALGLLYPTSLVSCATPFLECCAGAACLKPPTAPFFLFSLLSFAQHLVVFVQFMHCEQEEGADV